MADKAALRKELLARRAALDGRESRAVRIAEWVSGLPEFQSARLLSSYVGVGVEVATVGLIESVLASGRPVAVPWVGAADLHLTLIHSLAELEPAPFGLLEPLLALKQAESLRVDPRLADAYLVPGLAFDRRGGRLGHGKGYYDRLLRQAGPRPLRVALAYQIQLVDRVPMDQRDERMDLLVTEERVYRVSARTASAAR